MDRAQSLAPPPCKPLRLWPGVILFVLLLLFRFAVKALIPGFEGFMWAIEGSLGCAVAIILWWLFFSRAPWLDRIGAIVLIAAALGSAWFSKHESMGPAWMFSYAAPFVLIAFIAAAFAARNLPNSSRRLLIAAAILLSSLGWTLLRTEGINGDHDATFAWRWSATTEQSLLAKPIPMPAAPPVELAPSQPAVPAGEPKPAVLPAVAPEWPGFRGPNRDSVVPGVTITTGWSQSPPVEIWRKAVGPGWSSFAVQGSLIYTQEQRGAEELVTAYEAANGDLVWRHADRVRFFESNAGAGPRATPALAGGRVYTLGATGILNVLDAATGQRIWSRNTTGDTKRRVPDWGFSASPIVTQGLVIVYAGRLAAYEAATGNLKWLGESVGGSYSSPHLAAIGGVEQLLILTPQGAAGLDPATGAPIWSHQWKGLPIIQPTLIPGGGILISASQSEGTRRIDPVRGPNGWTVDTRWTSLALKPYFNDTVIHKGHAYGFDARILACIGLNDGQRIWKGGRYGNGQMLLLPDQDLLLILSEDGDLALVQASPSEFTELAKIHALEGKTWNHPVLASGLLLVRNAQEMAAFRLPTAGR
ncbi:MAG: PQQ-binding-like beta-propeller repeat protein [Candidatus Solibacter usitatus]|nr:PQQ-binding-like beta-propeller repeat protein [Candidatus Solibacter usitatus]